ncbi:hypothetical protein [Bdellovibrio bacteriovorus]|uniref:hypothetical protein n=1 Tax=Bdellovibrio bacteriovorus TaxID=959 RepID=UPI0035A5E234
MKRLLVSQTLITALFFIEPAQATTVPVLKSLLPHGKITSKNTATLYLNSSENVVCRFSTKNESFVKMPSQFKTTGTKTHAHGLSGLEPNKAYSYFIACQSPTSKKVSSTGVVNFITAATPVTLSSLAPNGAVTTYDTARLSLTTSEKAICRYSSTQQTFDKMTSEFKSTGSASHLHELTGLLPKTAYTYYVACESTQSKVQSSIGQISFTTADASLLYSGWLQLPARAFLNNPGSTYNAAKSCTLYKFYTSHPGMNSIISESFSKEATKSPAACRAFLEKHYLSHESCGLPEIDNKYWSVIGVLKDSADEKLVFNTSGGIKNVSLQQGSSVIVLPAAQCATASYFSKTKGVLWSKVGSCNYAQTKFCVNPNVPLLSQSAPKLPEFLAKATGISSIKRDMGWCAAVALTMSSLGALHSSPAEIVQDSFLWKSNLPTAAEGTSVTDMNERTMLFANLIHKIGNVIGTNWAKGGTTTERGIASLYSRLDPSIRNLNGIYYDGEVLRREFKILTDEWSKEALVQNLTVGNNVNFARGHAIIRDCYPQKVVKVKSDDKRDYWEASGYQCTWKKSAQTHALSVNGLEEDYVKIYDPWGKTYNLRVLQKTDVPNLNMKVALAIPVGAEGYFRDTGLMTDSMEGVVQKTILTKGSPQPVSRRVVNYYYIAIYGYQTGIVGKLKR